MVCVDARKYWQVTLLVYSSEWLLYTVHVGAREILTGDVVSFVPTKYNKWRLMQPVSVPGIYWQVTWIVHGSVWLLYVVYVGAREVLTGDAASSRLSVTTSFGSCRCPGSIDRWRGYFTAQSDRFIRSVSVPGKNWQATRLVQGSETPLYMVRSGAWEVLIGDVVSSRLSVNVLYGLCLCQGSIDRWRV